MEIKEEDKTCTKCKLKKLISEFSKDKRQNSGLHSWCKDCNHKRSKQYRIDHPEHCKKLDRNSNIRKCGATPEEWDAKFIEQSGCCAICGIHQSNLSKSFATDHDHITGKFRGLLWAVRQGLLLRNSARFYIEFKAVFV